jgi:hypothetical protein
MSLSPGSFPTTFLIFSGIFQNRTIPSLAVSIVWVALVCLAIFLGIALIDRKKHVPFSKHLFVTFSIIVVATTLFLSGSSITLLAQSYTHKPVRVTARLSVWACGQQLSLEAPTTPQDAAIGTSTFHLYSNGILTYTGIPKTSSDMSLGTFLTDINGETSGENLTIPLNNATYVPDSASLASNPLAPFIVEQTDQVSGNFTTGRYCSQSATPASVQAFVYTYNSQQEKYQQSTLGNGGAEYILKASTHPACIILDYGPLIAKTTYTCSDMDSPVSGGLYAR